jgi:hypothetical protein
MRTKTAADVVVSFFVLFSTRKSSLDNPPVNGRTVRRTEEELGLSSCCKEEGEDDADKDDEDDDESVDEMESRRCRRCLNRCGQQSVTM